MLMLQSGRAIDRAQAHNVYGPVTGIWSLPREESRSGRGPLLWAAHGCTFGASIAMPAARVILQISSAIRPGAPKS